MKRLLITGMTLALAACATPTDPDPPDRETQEPAVASVTVSAPLAGAILDVGAAAALTASAADASGNPVTATYSWSSSNEAVARVEASGLVRARAPGRATISAAAGPVSGTVDLRVVEADLEGFAALLEDPYAELLASDLEGDVASAWSECSAAHGAGSLTELDACMASLRAALDADSEPTRGPLRELVGLFADWMDRLLNVN